MRVFKPIELRVWWASTTGHYRRLVMFVETGRDGSGVFFYQLFGGAKQR